MWIVSLAAFALLAAPQQERAPALLELEPAQLEAWREHVRPDAAELAFEALPWIPSFSEGLERADEEGRPLLFWAMNGHPLGCT